MANVGGTEGAKEKKDGSKLIFEEFEPSSGWTEDSDCHYLLVDLPGFRTEEVKFQANSSGYMTISGERRVSESKHRVFKKTLKLPPNSHIEKAQGTFEDTIFCLVIPKKATKEEKQDTKDENRTAPGVGEETEKEKPSNKEEEMKRAKAEQKAESKSSVQKEGLPKEQGEKIRKPPNLLKCLMKKVKKNKEIILTAVLVFTLGIVVNRKFESNEKQQKST